MPSLEREFDYSDNPTGSRITVGVPRIPNLEVLSQVASRMAVIQKWVGVSPQASPGAHDRQLRGWIDRGAVPFFAFSGEGPRLIRTAVAYALLIPDAPYAEPTPATGRGASEIAPSHSIHPVIPNLGAEVTIATGISLLHASLTVASERNASEVAVFGGRAEEETYQQLGLVAMGQADILTDGQEIVRYAPPSGASPSEALHFLEQQLTWLRQTT